MDRMGGVFDHVKDLISRNLGAPPVMTSSSAAQNSEAVRASEELDPMI